MISALTSCTPASVSQEPHEEPYTVVLTFFLQPRQQQADCCRVGMLLPCMHGQQQLPAPLSCMLQP
jgi:hypothetical protein